MFGRAALLRVGGVAALKRGTFLSGGRNALPFAPSPHSAQPPPLQALARLLCSASGSGKDDDDPSNDKKGDGDAAPVAEPVDAPPEDPLTDAEEGTLPMSDEDGTLVKYSESISTMPPVLVFPFSNRPLFPGVYQPCEVTNEGLVAALVAAKNSHHPFVGVFLPRLDENGEQPELSNVTDPSQVHEVGTLAQITRLNQTPKGVSVLLLGGRRVTLDRVVQSAPVLLAKVEEAKDISDDNERTGPSLAKAYAMEVMQTIKEILKLNPFFKEQMQMILERTGQQSAAQAHTHPLRLFPHSLTHSLMPSLSGRLPRDSRVGQARRFWRGLDDRGRAGVAAGAVDAQRDGAHREDVNVVEEGARAEQASE